MTIKELNSLSIYDKEVWVSDHMICHMDYYDGPLSGLCYPDEEYKSFKVGDRFIYFYIKDEDFDDDDRFRDFTLNEFFLTETQKEYLDDYKKSFHHCFRYGIHNTGYYDGRDLRWFSKKWDKIGRPRFSPDASN